MTRIYLAAVIIFGLIFGSAAVAQTGQPAFFLLAQQSVCTSSTSATCPPSHITYILLIRQSGNPQSVAYQYTVTGTLASGAPVSVSGAVNRADDAAGNTTVSLDFGEAINEPTVTVQELGVLSTSLARVRR